MPRLPTLLFFLCWLLPPGWNLGICEPLLLANPIDWRQEVSVDHIMAYGDDTVKQRLALLDQEIVDHRYDASVRRIIGMYVERWRSGSARLLGRSAAYFPYFSEQLAEREMPDALKFLTVVESAFRPFATSRVGAGGLWQLMPATARELGLVVTDTLDERLDLELGTQAGLEYLNRQYLRFEDWALAMAAYNSGPGRVNRAIRRSGSRNYWKLRRFLPRETRNYVPRYIAAAYLMTYFSAHELSPDFLDPDLEITEMITVYQELSIHRIAQVTGLDPNLVCELNPAYLGGFLPALPGGRSLRLPARTVVAMQTYLQETNDPGNGEPTLPWASPHHHRTRGQSEDLYEAYHFYPAPSDTSAQQLAARIGVPTHRLLLHNGRGTLDSLSADQAWHYFRYRRPKSFGPAKRATEPAVALLTRPIAALRLNSPALKAPPPSVIDPSRKAISKDSSKKGWLSDFFGWLTK